MLTSTLNLLVNLLAVLAFVLIYGIEPRWTWLLLPVLLIPLVAFTAGVAMILSSLYVRYRDVAPIWSVISQMLFYATPIFYVVLKVPAAYRTAYVSNPLAAILTQARHWIVDPSAPTVSAVVGGLPAVLLPIAIVIAVLVYGVWIFNRMAPRIAEEL